MNTPTQSGVSARDLIAALEVTGEAEDALTSRLIAELRDFAVAGEDLQALLAREFRLRCERSAMIAEAAMMISELETGSTIRQLFSRRRPALRVIQ